MLDYESVRFSYSLLAASALYLFGGKNIKIDEVTGFSKDQLRPCAEWMHHFGVIVSRKLVTCIREIAAYVEPTDLHNIQTHRNALELLVGTCLLSYDTIPTLSYQDDAYAHKTAAMELKPAALAIQTPPSSTRKAKSPARSPTRVSP